MSRFVSNQAVEITESGESFVESTAVSAGLCFALPTILGITIAAVEIKKKIIIYFIFYFTIN
jgi:hypothetical protein